MLLSAQLAAGSDSKLDAAPWWLRLIVGVFLIGAGIATHVMQVRINRNAQNGATSHHYLGWLKIGLAMLGLFAICFSL